MNIPIFETAEEFFTFLDEADMNAEEKEQIFFHSEQSLKHLRSPWGKYIFRGKLDEALNHNQYGVEEVFGELRPTAFAEFFVTPDGEKYFDEGHAEGLFTKRLDYVCTVNSGEEYMTHDGLFLLLHGSEAMKARIKKITPSIVFEQALKVLENVN